MEFLKPYRSIFIKQKVQIALCIVVGFLVNTLGPAFALSIGQFYELYSHETSTKSQILQLSNTFNIRDFSTFFSVFFTLISVRVLLSFVFEKLQHSLTEEFTEAYRTNGFEAYLNGPSQSKEWLQKQFHNDFRILKNGFRRGVLIGSADLLYVVCFFGILCFLNFKLFLILFVYLVISILIIRYLVNSKLKNQSDLPAIKRRFLRFVNERIEHKTVFSSIKRRKTEQKRFLKKMEDFTEVSTVNRFNNLLIKWAIEGLTLLSVGLVLVSIVTLSEAREVIPFALTFAVVVFYLRPIFKRLLRLQNTLILAKNNFEMFNKIKSQSPSQRLRLSNGYVSFHCVGFQYSDTKIILSDLSFEAKNGEITQVSGSASAGKTTVLKLISGQLKPSKGIIYIDGQDIASIDDLEQYVGFVSTETPLVGSDIYEAIAESKNDFTKARVIQLLDELSGVFNLATPLEYDQKIGVNGQALSKTERVVVAFAKGILGNYPILLFDDPLASLSLRTQQSVVSYLTTLKASKTLIISTSLIFEDYFYDQFVNVSRPLVLQKAS